MSLKSIDKSVYHVQGATPDPPCPPSCLMSTEPTNQSTNQATNEPTNQPIPTNIYHPTPSAHSRTAPSSTAQSLYSLGSRSHALRRCIFASRERGGVFELVRPSCGRAGIFCHNASIKNFSSRCCLACVSRSSGSSRWAVNSVLASSTASNLFVF